MQGCEHDIYCLKYPYRTRLCKEFQFALPLKKAAGTVEAFRVYNVHKCWQNQIEIITVRSYLRHNVTGKWKMASFTEVAYFLKACNFCYVYRELQLCNILSYFSNHD